jgi:8-oxo-dGTP diphosphatase
MERPLYAMPFSYEYARPAVTTDSVVFAMDEDRLKVLLIKRGHDPFKDHWAFPGGFVDCGETVEAAAARELEEETGIRGVHLEQLHTYSDPNRDPREPTVTIVFYGLTNMADHAPEAGDDAGDVGWFPVDDLPPMAFDHADILIAARDRVAERLQP